MEQRDVIQSRLWNMVQTGNRKRILKARKSAPASLQPEAKLSLDTTSQDRKRFPIRSATAPTSTPPTPQVPTSPQSSLDTFQRCPTTEVVACIRIGSIYSSAGYCWKDAAGAISYQVLNTWPGCKHCPEEDSERILSDVVVERSSGRFVEMGYEAHKKYLHSTLRQRKRLIYLSEFAKIFECEKLEPVTDGVTAIDLTYGALCGSIIRRFRQVILADMDQHGLLHPTLKSFTWCAVVENTMAANNMEQVMNQMQKFKIVLARDATAVFLASIITDPSQPCFSFSRKNAVPKSQGFVSVQIGAVSTKVSLVVVTGNTVHPIENKATPIGSQTINYEIYKFILKIFGTKVIQTYKDEIFEGHLDLICAIEKAKRLAKPDEDLSVHLPFSFAAHFGKKCKGKLVDYARKVGCSWNSVNNSVLIPYKEYSVVFVDIVNKVSESIKTALEDRPAGLQIKYIPIYFTGGFSESLLFQTLIGQVLGNFRIVFPTGSRKMALLGAMRQIIESSVNGYRTCQSLFTIGMTVAAHYDTCALGSLPIKKITDIENAFLCNAFVPFVRKNDYLNDISHTVEHHFCAASPSQESILIRIFFATETLSRTIFEDLMENVAELRLPIPQNKRGITTGKLFIFHVTLTFENDPPGILISVEDDDAIVYGTCRILRLITF